MIRFENINKSFGKLNVLQNVNLEFYQGQSVAIIGPNSSGKTTLIKCLLGIVLADSGKILVENIDTKQDFKYRSMIGYMPQIGNYPPNLKIRQLFEMMIDIRNGQGNETEIDEEIIKLFKLREIYEKPLGTLSGGTKQKVSAALAFLFNPKILILDEPTAGLDPLSSEILKEKILKENQKGKLIIITSHILSDLDELATHILYIQEGQIQFFKELESLKDEVGETKLNRIIAQLMQKKTKIHTPKLELAL